MSEWRDVPGYEEYYQVSDDGQVKSKARTVVKGLVIQRRRERILAGHDHNWYRRVKMIVNGVQELRFVHDLMMAAFVGPRPHGLLIRHLNDIRTDNRLSNLAYGTHAENSADWSRNSGGVRKRPESCRNGHLYSDSNTRMYRGNRNCLTCLRANWARSRARIKAERQPNGTTC